MICIWNILIHEIYLYSLLPPSFVHIVYYNHTIGFFACQPLCEHFSAFIYI
nr:MAG TPA: hypothetical protein [Caudoviricetes sp.]